MHLFFVIICRVDFLRIFENSQCTLNTNSLFIWIYCNFCNCCNFFFQSVSIYRNTLCTFYFDFIVWPFQRVVCLCYGKWAFFVFQKSSHIGCCYDKYKQTSIFMMTFANKKQPPSSGCQTPGSEATFFCLLIRRGVYLLLLYEFKFQSIINHF